LSKRKWYFTVSAVIVLAAMLIISLFCLWRSHRLIDQMEIAEPIVYTETDEGKVTATLPSGESLTFSFGENRVSIENCSLAPSRENAIDIAIFIKGYAQKKGINIPRPLVMVIGEYRLHSVLTAIGYESHRTNNADIDYSQDSRWYVETMSAVFGYVGI